MIVASDDQLDTTIPEETTQPDPSANSRGEKSRNRGGWGEQTRRQSRMEKQLATFLPDSPATRTQYEYDQGNRILGTTGANTRRLHDNTLVSRTQINTVLKP